MNSNRAVLVWFLAVCWLALPALAQSVLIYQPLVPPSAAPGGPGFTLSVRGDGFTSGSVVQWNGKSKVTTLISSSQLNASILASDIATAGTASVTVKNPGGQISNFEFFSITPEIASLSTTRVDYAITPGSYFASRTLALDVNGDAKVDSVILNEEYSMLGSVSVALGNGDGTFQPPSTYVVGNSSSDMIATDVNGDHHVDLVVANDFDNTLSVLLGNGDGTFQTQVTYPAGSFPNALAYGDFNGDGKKDIIVTNDGSGVSVLLGNGDGTFQPPLTVPESGAYTAAAVGDFNGDSKLDIVVGNFLSGGNMLYVLLGNGDGTFQTPVAYQLPYYYPAKVAAADLNGDGKLDLAVAGTFLSTLTGNGDGTFQPAVDFGSESLMTDVSFGDLNGDGRIDIIGGALNSAIYYLGNGDGTFQDFVNLGLVITGDTVAVADLNRDGALDIVCGGASLFFNGTLPFAPAAQLSATALNFGTVTVGQSKSLRLTITNSGNAPLNVTNVETQGLARYTFLPFADACISQLYPGKSCTFAITFTPSVAQRYRGFLDITDDAGNSPQVVKMLGFGQ